MKWSFGLLLALAVVWLVVPRGGGSGGEGEVVESSRQVLDAAWRGKPEREMTIGEMERYAAGLGDEELWDELETAYEDWMEVNRGRKWFDQPRLAVMLAREIGKRDGEAGMKRVARWLKTQSEDFVNGEEDLLEMERQFVDLRVEMAGYAGWVSDDPEVAIGRLIESRKDEDEDWPVLYQGHISNFKGSGFYAMEEVLRDGLAAIASEDLDTAKVLLKGGLDVWAFGVNEVIESVLFEMPREEWSEFLEGLHEGGIFSPDGEWEEGLGELLRVDVWKPEFAEELILRERSDKREKPEIPLLLARARPREAIKILEDERADSQMKRWLVVFLGAEDVRNYHLLEQVPDDLKLAVFDGWFAVSQSLDFGPITGRENPGALNLDRMREVVREINMEDDVRGEIVEFLDKWGI